MTFVVKELKCEITLIQTNKHDNCCENMDLKCCIWDCETDEDDEDNDIPDDLPKDRLYMQLHCKNCGHNFYIRVGKEDCIYDLPIKILKLTETSEQDRVDCFNFDVFSPK